MTLPVLPFCMGYPEEICWTWFDILIYASTTQKIVCSFELSLFSCILTLVYQLIVKSMRAFVYRCLLLLWSIKPFYRGMIGETNSSTSSLSRIGSKKLCSADQNANPAFALFYLGVYHLYTKNVMGIAHHPMNSWYSDTSRHHYSFLGVVLSQPEYRQVNHDVWNQYS